MDPLSLTANIITLIDAANSVRRFINSVRHADAGFKALCTELASLSGFLQSIDRTMEECRRNPLSLAPIDQDLWKQAHTALADCQETLDELEALKNRMKGPSRSNTFFRKARLATDMQVHARDIVAFRDKIHMSNWSLQTLLQVINV